MKLSPGCGRTGRQPKAAHVPFHTRSTDDLGGFRSARTMFEFLSNNLEIWICGSLQVNPFKQTAGFPGALLIG